MSTRPPLFSPFLVLSAALLVFVRPALGQDGPAGDSPPVVGGVSVGDSAAAVRAALGQPGKRQESFGFVVWEYPERGLMLMWDREERTVRVMVLSRPAAGGVDGVRVGDAGSTLRQRWGSPARVRQDGRFLDFVRHRWTVTAELVGGVVKEITLQLLD